MAQPETAAEPLPPRRRIATFVDSPAAAVWATGVAVAASIAVLLVRLVPDVSGKPLFDDEVVAGLTAVHPLGELLDIVLFDRGGAPLHFLFAHFALEISPSPEALRWLSVVFAVATVLVCYDLGRRLSGRTAGAVAAIVAGTSSMLAVYGTVGRMYALFALASAVAVDLFARALDERTPSAVYLAAVAAWLLPAVHPYGLVIAGIEAAIGLWLWRGRPFKPAIPVLVLVVALTPFVIADLRLGERFGVGASAGGSVAPPDFAARQLGDALEAFAGGEGVLALMFFGLALVGLFVVFQKRAAFAVFTLLALAAVPILMVLARSDDELIHRLSPRHLMFGLPIWAALVGVGVARLVQNLPRLAVVAAVVAVGLAAGVCARGDRRPAHRSRPDRGRSGRAGRLGARPVRARRRAALLLPGLLRSPRRDQARDRDSALRQAAEDGAARRLPGAGTHGRAPAEGHGRSTRQRSRQPCPGPRSASSPAGWSSACPGRTRTRTRCCSPGAQRSRPSWTGRRATARCRSAPRCGRDS